MSEFQHCPGCWTPESGVPEHRITCPCAYDDHKVPAAIIDELHDYALIDDARRGLTVDQRAVYAEWAADFGDDKADHFARVLLGDVMADALAMDLEAQR
jgi:hypothetical protein